MPSCVCVGVPVSVCEKMLEKRINARSRPLFSGFASIFASNASREERVASGGGWGATQVPPPPVEVSGKKLPPAGVWHPFFPLGRYSYTRVCGSIKLDDF